MTQLHPTRLGGNDPARPWQRRAKAAPADELFTPPMRDGFRPMCPRRQLELRVAQVMVVDRLVRPRSCSTPWSRGRACRGVLISGRSSCSSTSPGVLEFVPQPTDHAHGRLQRTAGVTTRWRLVRSDRSSGRAFTSTISRPEHAALYDALPNFGRRLREWPPQLLIGVRESPRL
jgi:hypothetical protein